MKSFVIYFLALFAVACARSVVEDYQNVSGSDGNEIERIDDRIVGGRETTIEKHPHQLSLRRVGYRHICGASILTAVRALSRARCLNEYNSTPPPVPPTDFSILAGSTVRDEGADANAQIRTLSRYVLHEQAGKPIDTSNDIAILFWEQPLTFGTNVRPIKIPAANAPVPYGQNATLSGWGNVRDNGERTYILKELTEPLITNENCALADPRRVGPGIVCSGGAPNQGSCYGDGGGPLVHNNLLIGVTLYSRPCALHGEPTMYARVAFFVDWINRNI